MKAFIIKRITSLLFLVFLISLCLLPVCAEINNISDSSLSETNGARHAYSKGDLNGNGDVDSKDYLIVKRIFLRTYSPTDKQLFAADVNKDGSVTSVDYLMVKRHFYQTYFIPPCELKSQIPLSEEQIGDIKADYVEYLKTEVGEEHFESLTVSDIIIKKYYGPYSGGYALFISHKEGGYPQGTRTKFIAGYQFFFLDGQPLMVYKDSSFVEIKNAYESGMVSKDDVYDLFWYFRPVR